MSANDAQLNVDRFISNVLDGQYRELMMTIAAMAVIAGTIVFFPGFDEVTKGVQSTVTTELLVLFVLVAVVAGAVKGMIGFGYALITTPIFASVIDPTLAVVVLAIPPWMINMFQIGETDTGLGFIREEWALMVLAVVGSVLGVSFLARFSTGPIVPLLIGLIIFGYVVFQVVKNFVTVEQAHHPIALSVAGLVEGFLLAAVNLGPLLPAYFHTFERNTERYIGGLSMVLGTIFTVRIIQMTLFTDLMTTYRLWLGSVIAVVTIVGLLIGTYLRRLEFDEQKFNYLVVGLLFVIAVNIFRKTIPAILG